MQIIIDTDTISDSDRALLTSLLGTAPMPARVPRTPKAPKGDAAEPVPPAVAVEPEPVPPAVAAEPEAPTMADALAAATQAVSKGGSAKVKAALAVVDSKRVSEMKVEDISAFLAALSAE